MPWKDRLTEASFRGVTFKVEVGGKSGGRRVAPHEWPKKEVGYAEDMGRRSRRFRVSGYVIGDDYHLQRDALEAALDKEGAGTLKLPTSDAQQVICEHWDSIESRSRGRVCEFEMQFYEAGQDPAVGQSAATQPQARAAASNAADQAAASANKSGLSLGQWPIGWQERAQ